MITSRPGFPALLLSEFLCQTHAQRRSHVLTERSDAREAATLIKRQRFCLADARFQHQSGDAQCPRFGFKGIQNHATHSAPAFLGNDVHSLDLTCLRINAPDRPATHRRSGAKCNQEGSLAVGHFVRVEAEMTRSLFGVAGRQFRIQGFDKGLRRRGQNVGSLDDDTGRIYLFAQDVQDLDTGNKIAARITTGRNFKPGKDFL